LIIIAPSTLKSIWRVKIPVKVSFFAWLATLGKILTIDTYEEEIFLLWIGVGHARRMGSQLTMYYYIVIMVEIYGL